MGNYWSGDDQSVENDAGLQGDQLVMEQVYGSVINADNFDFRECVTLELVCKGFYRLVHVNCLPKYKQLYLPKVLGVRYANPDRLDEAAKQSLFKKVLKCRNLEEIYGLGAIFKNIDWSHFDKLRQLSKLHTLQDSGYASDFPFTRYDVFKRYLRAAPLVDSLAIRIATDERSDYEREVAEMLFRRPWKQLTFYFTSRHNSNRLSEGILHSIDPRALTELSIKGEFMDYGFGCDKIETAAFASFLKSCTALEKLNVYITHVGDEECRGWLPSLSNCPKLAIFVFAGHCLLDSESVFEALADCKQLKAISHRFYMNSETIQLYANSQPVNLETLAIIISPPSDQFSLKKIQNLKRLYIGCREEVLRPNMFPKSVEELRIKQNAFERSSLANVTQMKNLRVLQWFDAAEQFLSVCRKIGPQLEKLSVKFGREIFSDAVQAIAEHCQNLIELDIYDCRYKDSLEASILRRIAENCPKLTDVKLMVFGPSFQPDEETVATFMSRCPRLRCLQLNKKVSEEVKERLKEYKPRLVFGDWDCSTDGFGFWINC